MWKHGPGMGLDRWIQAFSGDGEGIICLGPSHCLLKDALVQIDSIAVSERGKTNDFQFVAKADDDGTSGTVNCFRGGTDSLLVLGKGRTKKVLCVAQREMAPHSTLQCKAKVRTNCKGTLSKKSL